MTGAITLPEDAVLTEGDTWSIELQDASKLDVPETIGAASGKVADIEAAEIPFVISYDPVAIDAGVTYTMRASVFDADGNLLYTSDTATEGIVDGVPLDQVPVQVQTPTAATEPPVPAVESPAA